MKKLSYLPIFALLLSCGSNADHVSKTDFSNITFAMDTVMVDAGDDIINLKNSLWMAGVNPSTTHLYNWDQDNGLLEKIDLDRLVLEKKLPFEKEGPNGVGSYVGWMYLTEEDQIVFSNFQDMGLFDFNGEKIRSYKLRGEKFEGDSLLDNENFTRKSIFSQGGNEIYGVLGNWTGNSFTLAKIDFPTKTLKKYPLPAYDKLAEYSVVLKSADMIMIIAAEQAVDKIENKVILSNSVFNSLIVYDISSDSVYTVNYPTSLTKNSKTGKYRNEVDTDAEFKKIMNEMNQEINFAKPFWDSQNQRYYRFSYETLPQETLEDGIARSKSKVYLTILDRDFQVLGETLVNELTSPPGLHFVKDGKIWIYKNIDDELAFVRLTIL